MRSRWLLLGIGRLSLAGALILPLHAAKLDFQRALQGDGRTNINGVVSDWAGNVYVAGSTTSSDLPIKNAAQPRNPGSAVTVSRDGGATWSPTGFIPEEVVIQPVKLPLRPTVLLTLGVHGVYRSTNGGETWQTAYDVDANRRTVGYIRSIDYDPRNPSTVYVSASGGVLKSTDAGVRWTLLTNGLAAGGCCLGSLVAVDPFRPGRLFYSLESRAYVSTDSGATWRLMSLPAALNPRLIPSPWQQDSLYAYTYGGASQSSDGGATWQQLPLPISGLLSEIVPHPARHGRIFALTGERVLRSDDYGLTWTEVPYPGEPNAGGIGFSLHPTNPDYVFLGGFESMDGGRNWKPNRAGRALAGLFFDPVDPRQVYAGGWITSDAFVAKLSPQGEIEYLTYLGGQGGDQASSIAVDASGNVYLGGAAESHDFPGTGVRPPDEVRPEGFAAKLDASGRLLFTALFGEQIVSVAADAAGHMYVASRAGRLLRLSADGTTIEFNLEKNVYSFAVDEDGSIVLMSGTRLARLSPAGTELFSRELNTTGLVTTANGNIYIATAASGTPTVSANAYQKTTDTSCSHNSGHPALSSRERASWMTDVYVKRLRPDGELVFATLLGGSCRDFPTGISVAQDGTVWVAGTTYSTPFPSVDSITGPPPSGKSKAFLARLDADGSKLLFSSYSGTGNARGVAVGPESSVYTVGNSALNLSYGYAGPALLWRVTPGARASGRTPRRVSNAFHPAAGVISPGEIVKIELPGLAPEQELDLRLHAGGEVLEFGGVSVTFDGIPARMIAVQRDAIVCISPNELTAPLSATVQVRERGSVTEDYLVEVKKYNVAFFPQVWNGNGTLNSRNNPVQRGAPFSVFITGAGSPALKSVAVEMSGPFGTPSVTSTTPVDPIPGFVDGLYEIHLHAPTIAGAWAVAVLGAGAGPDSVVAPPAVVNVE